MHPQISVILPVFNAGNFLSKCLQSIQIQTFQDFEVLMIDDGSTDNSPAICNTYVEADQRFIYLRKANGGVSSARNLGIDSAKGRYIAFIDSDDFVDPNFFETVVATAEAQQCEILNFGHSYFKDASEIIRNPAFADQESVSRSQLLEVLRHSASNKFLYFCWSRLFRTDFLKNNQIRFNERSLLGSDSLFNLEAFLTATRIYAIHFHPYHYIYNDSSLTQRKFKDDLLYKYETQFQARLEIQSKHPDAWSEAFRQDIAANYLQNALFMILFNLKSHAGDRVAALHEIWNSPVFKFSLQNAKRIEGISFTMRLKIFLFRYRLFSLLNLLNRR